MNDAGYAYLKATLGGVERREVVGLAISYNWHTERFLP